MSERVDNIVIENGKILFRNFEGRETQYNRSGSRNFCAVIDDPEMANKLKTDGWNVRELMARDEGDEPTYYLKVNVGCNKEDGRLQPKVVRVVGRNNKLELNEDTIYILDTDEISSVDLIIRPYNWTVNGKSGIAAYLKTGYFVVEEDEFAAKYDDDRPPFD